MKKMKAMMKMLFRSRRCRYCGYNGGGWKDDDQCPSCGEVN
ncbi:MAG: hypothetical protein Q4D77_00275 [Peptostreptococcaceae bacterium]|nr:hypothetical protein [Peptostreptococcaceae bacterium]